MWLFSPIDSKTLPSPILNVYCFVDTNRCVNKPIRSDIVGRLTIFKVFFDLTPNKQMLCQTNKINQKNKINYCFILFFNRKPLSYSIYTYHIYRRNRRMTCFKAQFSVLQNSSFYAPKENIFAIQST